jgi:hypothetical protein
MSLPWFNTRGPNGLPDLQRGLAALWPSYLAYALTFLFIGQVWANNHVMFDQGATALMFDAVWQHASHHRLFRRGLDLRARSPSAGVLGWRWRGSRWAHWSVCLSRP